MSEQEDVSPPAHLEHVPVASPKKQRKQAKLKQQRRHPAAPGPHRHPDGDRRRRGARRVEDAIAEKRMLQQLYGLPLPDGSGGEERPG
ncbi:MAG TPA: hypothetical protein VIL46_05170 [Gemmataceae bacterium]